MKVVSYENFFRWGVLLVLNQWPSKSNMYVTAFGTTKPPLDWGLRYESIRDTRKAVLRLERH